MSASVVSLVEPMQVDVEVQDGENVPVAAADDEEQRTFLIENPNLDLEGYANGYAGYMKTMRLIFVAQHCPSLRIESYRMAISHVKKTLNVALYQQLHDKLLESLRLANLPTEGLMLDVEWVDQTTKHAETLLEKLETDLKTFKNAAIKESIRRGFDDLGLHYLNMGDLQNALKFHSRARDYCSSPKNIVIMCINVIKVCVFLGNWQHVLSYVAKAEGTGLGGDKDHCTPQLQTKLRCAAGLANLAMGKYKLAAKNFLQSSIDHCEFPELMSASNVTVYGSLCALATFTREELQTDLINCSSFKMMLELEPNLREIVFAFYKSQYARCLELLSEVRENLRLDMHLSPHINNLCQQIRFRALVQSHVLCENRHQKIANSANDLLFSNLNYFSPYKVADMHKMAAAFKCSVNELENELMPLIFNGQIPARIDSQKKVLHLRQTNQRSLTFAKTFKVGADYLHRGKALVLRNAIIHNNIQVQQSDANK